MQACIDLFSSIHLFVCLSYHLFSKQISPHESQAFQGVPSLVVEGRSGMTVSFSVIRAKSKDRKRQKVKIALETWREWMIWLEEVYL
jgi:hypothetical protein